jgi:predicted NBD/HSP70 family sugar kinase
MRFVLNRHLSSRGKLKLRTPPVEVRQKSGLWFETVASSFTRTTRSNLSVTSGAGEILRLIREGRASTRRDIADLSGLARSTVAQRVDSLLESGLIVPASSSVSTGGRPPTVLVFNAKAGVVLAAAVGASHSRLAVTDLASNVLAEASLELPVAVGPDEFLPSLGTCFDELLSDAQCSREQIRSIGVGVPGPVEFATGMPVRPPIMPGWDGYPLASWLENRFGVPALVDNDVNVIALGEYSQSWMEVDHMAVVKVSTGIGLGLVANRRIFRGALGAAGDIGHIHVMRASDVVCSCGNTGCLEAVAGGRALAARLRESGTPADSARDVVRLVAAGHPEATRLVRDAGREIGAVLAAVVNLFNPAVVVVTGDLAEAGEHLLAGVREAIYRRSTALATHSLRIVRGSAGDLGGVIGASVLAIEHVLSPEAVDGVLARPALPPR